MGDRAEEIALLIKNYTDNSLDRINALDSMPEYIKLTIDLLTNESISKLKSYIEQEWTLIHWAVANEHNHLLEALLKVNVSQLNTKTSVGNTPLHIAVINGNNQAVYILLEYGANYSIINSQGHTQWDIILKKESGYILISLTEQRLQENNRQETREQRLFSQKAKKEILRRELLKAMAQSDSSLIRKYIQQISVSMQDRQGNTLLHHAIAQGDKKILYFFLSLSPRAIIVKNNLGKTPIEHALALGFTFLEIFLDAAFGTQREDEDINYSCCRVL